MFAVAWKGTYESILVGTHRKGPANPFCPAVGTSGWVMYELEWLNGMEVHGRQAPDMVGKGGHSLHRASILSSPFIM